MYPQDPLGSEEAPGSGYLHHLRRFRVSSSKTTPSESPKKSSGSSVGFPAGVNLRASAITLARPFRAETDRDTATQALRLALACKHSLPGQKYPVLDAVAALGPLLFLG